MCFLRSDQFTYKQTVCEEKTQDKYGYKGSIWLTSLLELFFCFARYHSTLS